MKCFQAVGLASVLLVLACLASAIGAGGKDKKFEIPKDAIAGKIGRAHV